MSGDFFWLVWSIFSSMIFGEKSMKFWFFLWIPTSSSSDNSQRDKENFPFMQKKMLEIDSLESQHWSYGTGNWRGWIEMKEKYLNHHYNVHIILRKKSKKYESFHHLIISHISEFISCSSSAKKYQHLEKFSRPFFGF